VKTRRRNGFTLVELLIVLSIVLVLVAIAVPEYLESKVVSDVARTHSDLRKIQTALDSYFVDFCVYPPSHDPDSYPRGLTWLTSPFPYLRSIPHDPFASPLFGEGPEYEGGSTGVGTFGNIHDSASHSVRIHAYLVMGVGPDQRDSVLGNDWFPGRKPGGEVIITSYAPTNGLESSGDIIRMTGSYKEGRVILDGVTLGG
jgi:prepilin-type N-terminal cleavage/methylation domain-containing protein